MHVSVCYHLYVTRIYTSRSVCFRMLLICYLSRVDGVLVKNLYPVFSPNGSKNIHFEAAHSSMVHTVEYRPQYTLLPWNGAIPASLRGRRSKGKGKGGLFCNSWINHLCCFSLIIININCYMLLGNQYLCKYLCITFTFYCTNLFYYKQRLPD